MPIVDKFVPPHPLNTAVLFLIFNRPGTTKRVFEAIKQAKPPRLYIAGDGPRDWKKGEDKIVQQVREYVLNNIDWNCEVKILFRDKNLGCGKAVSEAITWFFVNEEMGIILEDDCLPSQSFFWFCEELLDRYKNDLRVWHIGGFSLQNDLIQTSYRFSRLIPIWGWATWRRAWKYYDFEMKDLDKISDEVYTYFGKHAVNVKRTFLEKKEMNIDTWDIQWAFTCVKYNAFSILPKRSLVKNIGFGPGATHTKSYNRKIAKIKNNELEFPLIHPKDLALEEIQKLDEEYLSIFYKKSFFAKVKAIVKYLWRVTK